MCGEDSVINIFGVDSFVFPENIMLDFNSSEITGIRVKEDRIFNKLTKTTYNPFSFKVKNSENYDKLFTYLFPSQLNSYQRISGANGKFDYPLNDGIQYDLCIVGISEKGYFHKEQKGLNKRNLGTPSLTDLSEKELNEKIKSLNESRGIIKSMVIEDEIS